ncbi:MAG: hypothetical protein KC897_13045, partial [Candidatus Omnitrophica bacterium]|nr:hypothetical protein [Candidatus Omnitrophota bacterium]
TLYINTQVLSKFGTQQDLDNFLISAIPQQLSREEDKVLALSGQAPFEASDPRFAGWTSSRSHARSDAIEKAISSREGIDYTGRWAWTSQHFTDRDMSGNAFSGLLTKLQTSGLGDYLDAPENVMVWMPALKAIEGAAIKAVREQSYGGAEVKVEFADLTAEYADNGPTGDVILQFYVNNEPMYARFQLAGSEMRTVDQPRSLATFDYADFEFNNVVYSASSLPVAETISPATPVRIASQRTTTPVSVTSDRATLAATTTEVTALPVLNVSGIERMQLKPQQQAALTGIAQLSVPDMQDITRQMGMRGTVEAQQLERGLANVKGLVSGGRTEITFSDLRRQAPELADMLVSPSQADAKFVDLVNAKIQTTQPVAVSQELMQVRPYQAVQVASGKTYEMQDRDMNPVAFRAMTAKLEASGAVDMSGVEAITFGSPAKMGNATVAKIEGGKTLVVNPANVGALTGIEPVTITPMAQANLSRADLGVAEFSNADVQRINTQLTAQATQGGQAVTIEMPDTFKRFMQNAPVSDRATLATMKPEGSDSLSYKFLVTPQAEVRFY